MGLHPWEFERYTFEEFILRLRGHQAKNVDEWKQTRLLFFGIAKLGGAKAKKPEDLMKLGNEEESGGTRFRDLTPEQRKKWQEHKRKQFKNAFKNEIKLNKAAKKKGHE